MHRFSFSITRRLKILKPEIAFKGRCKRFLSLFDLPNLGENERIRLRCIGRLPADQKVYSLELERGGAKITVAGEEQDIPAYLKSQHF